ncbi:MAG: TerC/Alx family metal homeostasis membrane protein [Streptosporangiales bacterium]|nr:TerC/Alx family metal homeostasis membrane protein [Streptosporangiales bacterium]
MNVPAWVWFSTVGAILLVITADLLVAERGGPREFTLRQATAWVSFYVSLAMLFFVGLFFLVGGQRAGEFIAGYLTEYSLSVDNLFVFYLILARFRVPKENQHRVLLIGILMALGLRGMFIAAGAAAVARFQWLFFLFGAFLIYTAIGLLRGGDDDDFSENRVLRFVRRVLPTTPDYHGTRLTVRTGGSRLFTPMLVVMVAIGTTDLLFALDSIPAIFGLTTEPYLIFTANAFALMGLRQLYFLLGGLLERLVYLDAGLAAVLSFIGVKLILEALHGIGVHWAPVVPIWLSLIVIVTSVLTATLASLVKMRRDASRDRDGSRERRP